MAAGVARPVAVEYCRGSHRDPSAIWGHRSSAVPAKATHMRRSPLAVALVVGLVAAVLALPVAGAPALAGEDVAITSLSNRADVIAGGDVLIEVSVPAGASLDDLAVTVGGRDVTAGFAEVDGKLRGLVDGLPLGASTIEAVLPTGFGARLEVDNHPIGGPVFAGPQVQPWICNTEDAGLSAPTDDQCNAPTVTTYLYMSSVTQQFAAYDPASPPGDVATTTTDEGLEVPYVVRLETGTIDRGINQLAVLADPDAPWTPLAPQPSWNGKLVYVFGGGTGPEHTQALPGGVLIDSALSRGFMVASSSLSVHGQNANDTVAAEVVMMVQEHIIETYGPLRYTIGQGCSGGGLQQHIIADTYPGILDGLIPNCSYPDLWTPAMEVADCVLLNRYFEQTSPELWPVVEQRAFVTGHQEIGSCQAWAALFGPRFDPSDGGNCDLPDEVVYDPDTNPTGPRCLLNDYQVAIWGPRVESEWGPVEQAIGRGFAKRPVSTVGVQYGLGALEDGTILVDQFVDMNALVGGVDIDNNVTAERSPMSSGAGPTAYRTGQIVLGTNLDQVPIIDLRGHDNTEIHTDVYSHITSRRLIAANGHADNQAIWTGVLPLLGEPEWVFCGEAIGSGTSGGSELPTAPIPCSDTSPFLLMDTWLTAIEADTSSAPLEDKVLTNRPDAAVDTCFIGGQAVTEEAACAAAYPVFETTRMAAGGPLTNDIIDCALVPLDRDGYSVTFTDAQWTAMQTAFPTGVCDYSQPGLGYQQAVDTWLSFPGNGAAPVPLGPAPVSVPFGPTGAAPSGSGPNPAPASSATPAPAASAAAGLPATGPSLPTWLGLIGLALAATLTRRSSRGDPTG